MINNEKLELLSLSSKFRVAKSDKEYSVEYIGANDGYSLFAFISEDGISYCIGGVYNSGSDFAEIDINALGELIRFCTLMTKEGNNEQTL